MLKAIDAQVRELALSSLWLYLKNVFGPQLADWFCAYWEVIDESQLDLITSLSHTSKGVDYEIMRLSLVTVINDT